jgi:hypothetical protein
MGPSRGYFEMANICGFSSFYISLSSFFFSNLLALLLYIIDQRQDKYKLHEDCGVLKATNGAAGLG